MLQAFSMGLSLLLILTGLFFIFYLILNRLLFSTGENGFYTVVIGKSDDETLCDKIYGAFIQANTLNFSKKQPVYVIDCGLSEKQKELFSNMLYSEGSIVYIQGECIGAEDEYIVICLDKE